MGFPISGFLLVFYSNYTYILKSTVLSYTGIEQTYRLTDSQSVSFPDYWLAYT